MAEFVVLETNAEILAEIGECLASGGVGDRGEFHLVLSGKTPIEEVLCRTRPRLVITSWRWIGPRVVAAVQALDPRPTVWVITNYDFPVVRAQSPARVDRILDKFNVFSGVFPDEVRSFLETGRSE